jgi:hypothetical protein
VSAQALIAGPPVRALSEEQKALGGDDGLPDGSWRCKMLALEGQDRERSAASAYIRISSMYPRNTLCLYCLALSLASASKYFAHLAAMISPDFPVKGSA